MVEFSRSWVSASAILAVAFTVAPALAESAKPVDFAKYFRSSANISAIAAALSLIEPCKKKPEITESAKGGRIRLSFTCPDPEATAVIEFRDFGDGVLVPDRFYIAG